MTIVYFYEQIIRWEGEDKKHITISTTRPRIFKPHGECLGKLELSELHYTEKVQARNEYSEDKK